MHNNIKIQFFSWLITKRVSFLKVGNDDEVKKTVKKMSLQRHISHLTSYLIDLSCDHHWLNVCDGVLKEKKSFQLWGTYLVKISIILLLYILLHLVFNPLSKNIKLLIRIRFFSFYKNTVKEQFTCFKCFLKAFIKSKGICKINFLGFAYKLLSFNTEGHLYLFSPQHM